MLLCLSASHRTAAFDLLERLSVSATELGSELVEASPTIEGAVVLATCNRFEAYLEVGGTARADESESAVRRVAELTGVDVDQLRGAIVVHSGGAVAEHLFAVSSGLESVVVGEGEIAGQVRRALETARASGTTSPHLERLFQRASTASREVQNTTGLSGAGRSIVRLALDLASSRIADWREQEVLLVGTGAYAGASLAALRDRGVGEVTVFSPSGRASRFATREGVRPLRELHTGLAAATVVVTCSGASEYVLTPELVAARESRSPLLVIDLGLPRNVDPRVGDLAGVDLLDLETVRLHAPLSELTAPDEARDVVGRAAAQFTAESSEHQVTSAVVAFRTHVFGILEAELARLGDRGMRDQATERALRHLVSVLVHQPSRRAKDLARAGQAERVVDAFNTLFDLGTGLDEEEAGRTSEAV